MILRLSSTAARAFLVILAFLFAAGLDVRRFWGAGLVSITFVTLVGYCATLLSNRKAKSSYIAEYHRLNRVDTPR